MSPLHGLLPTALSLLFLMSQVSCKKAAEASDEDSTPKPVVAVTTAKATSGPIAEEINVTGTLAPMPGAEAKIAPLAPGRIKDVLVVAGQLVRKGQPIATLDPGVLSGQVLQARATVDVAKSTLQQSKTNLGLQIATQQQNERQAQIALQAAQVALQKLRAGSRPQEIRQAEASLLGAQAAMTQASQNLARSNTLFSEGLLARKDLEAAQSEATSAKAAVASAQQALGLARQGNRPEDIRAGEIAVDQAKQQLDLAVSQRAQIQAKEQDIRISEAQLAANEGALTSAESQTRALTITSPVSGTVINRLVNSGEMVDVTTTIANVANLDRARLELNVPVTVLYQIVAGQPVSFTTDADPNIERTATVALISKATDPNTNTVLVEAIAANRDHRLRDDGFVRAAIVVRRHSNATIVPSAAVVDKDGKATVFTIASDTAHAQLVTVGMRSDDQVEILSGLKPGDVVVTTGAYELDDGVKVDTGGDKEKDAPDKDAADKGKKDE